MSDNLRSKTVKGVGWSFTDNIANQGISFVVGLVLARLLSPEEYGLIGVILIFIGISNSLVDCGFSNALIRKNTTTDTDYNTVFIVNMAVSIVLFLILWMAAPAIAKFFGQFQLVPLTRAMAVVPVINAFGIIQRTIFVKRIDFRTQTKISFIASGSSGVIGIGMAVGGLGGWSLVGQQISRQLLNTVFLWGYNTWRPRKAFSVESFRELFGFGWKLLVAGMIDTGWREIYKVVIGKFYAPVTLGQYTRAEQFASIFSSNITTMVQRVSYPVLSSIQDDRIRLKAAYRKVIISTMWITFTCMLGLVAIARPMVVVLIGEQWLPCVPMLQIVCFSMMLYPLHAINLNMLQVQGRSDLFLRLEIIKKIIAVGPILLGVFFNIYYMLIGSAMAGFISYYLNAYYSGPFLGYSIAEQVKDILPSFAQAFAMAVVVALFGYLPFCAFVVLPIQLAVGALMVWGLNEWMQQEEYLEMKRIAMTAIERLKRR
ncbi:MAG: lipopolysaccharide biosynthesis protein [Alistipes sp.]|nr:lipopolysaccharide biosynthesis protein [Alistipes sp.]